MHFEQVRDFFRSSTRKDIADITAQQQTSCGQDVLVVVNDQDVGRIGHCLKPG